MSDLATMKARIASELRRSNITSQIASAISTAIQSLEDMRFNFDESRAITFTTVADQEFYDGNDSALIPRIQKIDYVKLIISNYPYDLLPETPERIETLNSNGTQTGEPKVYCYYGQQIRLSYIPSDAWTVRIGGVIRIPEPASDSEADNPWMIEAERAVRCRAKYELYEHVLKDAAMAQRFHPDNEVGPTHEAMRQLRRRTNQLQQQGGFEIKATSW